MPDKTEDKVNNTSHGYDLMATKWGLIDDLLGGTEAMRKAGTKWLPMEDRELATQYNRRLARSILYNAFADTIQKVVAKPFSKPVTLINSTPELDELAKDVDGKGRDITQYGRDWFAMSTTYGVASTLVTFPKNVDDEGNIIDRSLGEELEIGQRPSWILIPPHNIIGWRTELGLDGQPVLTQVRIKEITYEPVGNFSEKVVNRIRVITPTDQTLYIWDKDSDKYVFEEAFTHSFGSIPLESFYTRQIDFLVGFPPYERLAWLNLAHWQSMSDQRNILRYIRFPLLKAIGLTQAEIDAGFVLGPNNMIATTNSDADISYIEHTGKAAEVGNQDLVSLEERMEVLGLQPIMSKLGNVKATGQAISEAKLQSTVQAWIREFEFAVENAFRLSAKWLGKEVPEDFEVQVYSDFSLGLKASEDIDAIIRMYEKRLIDQETAIKEVKRRGIIDESVDVDEVVSKIESMGPSLGMLSSVNIEDDNA